MTWLVSVKARIKIQDLCRSIFLAGNVLPCLKPKHGPYVPTILHKACECMMPHAKWGHALKDVVCMKQPWKTQNLIWATFPSPFLKFTEDSPFCDKTGFEVCVIKCSGIIFTSKNTLRARFLFSKTGSFPLASASHIIFLHFKHDSVWFPLLPSPLREVHEGV